MGGRNESHYLYSCTRGVVCDTWDEKKPFVPAVWFV